MIIVTVVGNGLAQLEEATRILGSEGKARVAFARAINRTATTVKKEAGQALADQTGLPRSTGRRAYAQKNDRATAGNLSYVVHGSGGNVSLKYFSPKESDLGVIAKPWNTPITYLSTFLKAGWWPRRVNKPHWNGQVFIRVGDGHSYNVAKGNRFVKRKRVGTKFQKVDSGLFIPTEQVTGAAAAAWNKGARHLQPRIDHEVRVITKGIVS